MDKLRYGGRLIEAKMCEVRVEYPAPEPEPLQNSSSLAGSRYVLMPRTDTYAKGVEALRKELEAKPTAHPTFTLPDGNAIYRPLTFKETIRARVENYETLRNEDGSERSLEERLSLIKGRWNDTCTAVAYKTGTNKFKIIPESPDLITIAPDFKEEFIAGDFDSLPGMVLDSAKGKYNDWLTKAAVLKHPAWMATVEDDAPLLAAYAEIIFAELKKRYQSTEGMGFWMRKNTDADELRALYVDDLTVLSNAGGINFLNVNCSFLRVAGSDSK